MTISVKQITLYTFDDLPSFEAKETARAWFREGGIHLDHIEHEGLKSIQFFLAALEIGWSHISTNDLTIGYSNAIAAGSRLHGLDYESARRLKLSDGYYIGENLKEGLLELVDLKMHNLNEFDKLVRKALKTLQKDMEESDTDEWVDDSLIANEYTFTVNGSRLY